MRVCIRSVWYECAWHTTPCTNLPSVQCFVQSVWYECAGYTTPFTNLPSMKCFICACVYEVFGVSVRGTPHHSLICPPIPSTPSFVMGAVPRDRVRSTHQFVAAWYTTPFTNLPSYSLHATKQRYITHVHTQCHKWDADTHCKAPQHTATHMPHVCTRSGTDVMRTRTATHYHTLQHTGMPLSSTPRHTCGVPHM